MIVRGVVDSSDLTLNVSRETLLTPMKEGALKDKIEKAVITERLTTSPCALVASSFACSVNMERIMKAQTYPKGHDPNNKCYATQKKTLELNPRHPLVKELKQRVEDSKDDQTTKDLVVVLLETKTFRLGSSMPDMVDFAGHVERTLRLSIDISLDENIDAEEEEEAAEDKKVAYDEEDDDDDDNTSDNEEQWCVVASFHTRVVQDAIRPSKH